MDRAELVGADGSFLIDGLSNHVDDPSQGLGAHGDLDRVSSVQNLLAPDQALGGIERDGPDVAAAEMLGDLKDESVLSALDLKRVENRGQLSVKLNVDDGTDNLGYFSRERSSRTE